MWIILWQKGKKLLQYSSYYLINSYSMKKKSALLLITSLVLTLSQVSAYDEVQCNTNPVFTENTCNQCFTGGAKAEGDNLGFLADDWLNETTMSQIIYKEEQKLPYMINLGGEAAVWTQTPSETDFWEYTSEVNALFSADEEWYVLTPGQKVTWLKSKLGYAYQLGKNTVPAWENVGMLVYTIKPHNILENGEVTIEDAQHTECVLFTSWVEAATPVALEKPKELPQTGPEHIFLIALALLLGFGLIRFTRKA